MSYSMMLKTARRRSGHTLREVAAALGLTPSTVYRYEEGLILRIPPETLRSLCAFYGISPREEAEGFRLEQEKDRLSRYSESRLNVSADFLYRQYMQLDQRGRKNVLNLLQYELSLQGKESSTGLPGRS